jgi:L-lactate dehydrogenase complex protein LldF
VVVDNGRSAQLKDRVFRRSLTCIRCGACMNTCPVFRRSGGFSYGYTVPGPIGTILAPGRDAPAHRSLPFASTLCGSCSDVCPVKIDLHHEILAWRQELVRRGLLSPVKRAAMMLLGVVFRVGWLYRLSGWLARQLVPRLPRAMLYTRFNAWGRQRELPPMPRETFRALYRRHRGHP